MSDDFQSKKALEFFESTFALSDQLKQDLSMSINLSIILVVGPARSGKSTLCNILLIPKLCPEKVIFLTDEGNTPVTMEIHYAIIKLSDLLRIHNLDIGSYIDSDLFIFDCEGIDSLGKVTESLRKAIFTFLQISTVNIFVSKNIDRSNIYDLKSFFSLPQLIGGSQPLSKGSAIVLTDNGVPGNPSEDEYEEKRRQNDEKELDKVLAHLEQSQMNFSRNNIAFFAQPKWAKEKHYFESINDLIRFIVNITSIRVQIPGSNLIQIFEKCIPVISKINDLDDPDIRIDLIVHNLINEYFKQAYDYTIMQLPSYINEYIANKMAADLIELSKIHYYEQIQEEMIQVYEKKANEIYLGITDIFSQMKDEYLNKLKDEIQQKVIEAFEKRCQVVVIPFFSEIVLGKTREIIINDFSQNDGDSLKSLNIPQVIIHYQHVANELFDEQLHSINENLTKCSSYNSQLKIINSAIASEVVISQQNEKINRHEDTIAHLTEMLQNLQTIVGNISHNGINGTLFFSMRVEDKLPYALKCNGQTINISEYPDFVEHYLKTNLVSTVTIQEWKRIKQEINNVGHFGYDMNGSVFIAPFIPSGTFLSNSNVDIVNGKCREHGEYMHDQIVNIKGSSLIKIMGKNHEPVSNSGCLSSYIKYSWPGWLDKGSIKEDWDRAQQFDFDASKSVPTGDRVMPRTLFLNLFVMVSGND